MRLPGSRLLYHKHIRVYGRGLYPVQAGDAQLAGALDEEQRVLCAGDGGDGVHGGEVQRAHLRPHAWAFSPTGRYMRMLCPVPSDGPDIVSLHVMAHAWRLLQTMRHPFVG